jgi:hypothetical protein
MEMTRELYLSMLRRGNNGSQILDILSAITSDENVQFVNNSMSNEVEDTNYSENEDEMVIENEEEVVMA